MIKQKTIMGCVVILVLIISVSGMVIVIYSQGEGDNKNKPLGSNLEILDEENKTNNNVNPCFISSTSEEDEMFKIPLLLPDYTDINIISSNISIILAILKLAEVNIQRVEYFSQTGLNIVRVFLEEDIVEIGNIWIDNRDEITNTIKASNYKVSCTTDEKIPLIPNDESFLTIYNELNKFLSLCKPQIGYLILLNVDYYHVLFKKT